MRVDLTRSVSQKIARNTVFNLLGRFWGLGISILLTPYIVSRLGIERFGIWALVAVIVNYFGLLDLGMGTGFLKYIAEYHTKKEYKRLNQVVNTGFLFYSVLGVVFFVLCWALKTRIVGLFRFSSFLHNEILFVLGGMVFITAIRGMFMVYRAVANGVQRMDITNTISIIVSVPNAIGTILFLALGYGLRGLILNGIMVACLTILLQVFWAYRLVPELKFAPFTFDRKMFQTLFSYGIKVEISKVSELTNLHVDKLLLGHFIGASVVAFYELGSKISNVARSLPEMLLPAITPAASELDALHDRRRLADLYVRGSKYIALITVPMGVFVFINASLIMLLWMGTPGYEKSALAIQFLIIAYSAYLFTGVGRLIARGTGIPQYEMKSALLIAILNISLSVVLIIKVGFVGALVGTTVSSVVGSLCFVSMFHKRLGHASVRDITRIYVLPVVGSVLGVFCLLFANRVTGDFCLSPAGRWEAFALLFIDGIIYTGIYLLVIWKTNYMDEYDRVVLRRVLRRRKT